MKIYSDISSNPSQSISAAQNQYVLVQGSDEIIRKAPLTVNGVAMGANGNITTAITAVLTGPSASGTNNLIASSSTSRTSSIANATVWVVSGDSSVPDPDGLAYIFVSQSATAGNRGEWFPLSTLNQSQADLRYIKLSSATTQNVTSSLIISGSTTFSGSILWSGSSNANGATANVVVLSNGQLYVTGAYGAGGGGGPANPGSPFNSIQYNNAGGFAGSSSFTFNGTDTVNLTGSFIVSGSTPLRVIGGTSNITGSLIVSNSLNVIGTSRVTGSFIVSSSTNLIGTTNITGSLIVSSSSNVIGVSQVTGSLIVSSSSQIIGTETITGSLIVSSSSNVIGTSRVTGSLIVSNSFSTIGTGSITGSLSISSSVPGQTVLQITGTGSNTTAPMVQIAGQTGAFVQVYDFNSGSLFSVNSNTGNAIIDVISTGQTLIGSNTYQGMYDSTGYALMPAPGQVLTIPGYLTSSYNALWFEYFTNSGSYSRTGTFSVIWSGSTSASIDTTSSFLGSVPTNNITFTASISSSYMQLIASASTNGWLIKGSIRGI